MRAFAKYAKSNPHGTIIHFAGIKDGVRRSADFLTKLIALYFRFSLLDDSFSIFLNDKKVTHKNLKDLADKTQFLWKIGNYNDPYVTDLEKTFTKNPDRHQVKALKIPKIKGFIASVERPRDLKIMTTDERVGIDLFVNGRLRERDILKHIPTARIAESYLYGQIHFDGLDDKVDRFTSSREGIVADDVKFQKFLTNFKKTIQTVVDDWDKGRIKRREDGDSENDRIPKSERASLGLYGAVSKAYESPKDTKKPHTVDKWVDELSADAAFNFESYAECFISENLVRRYTKEKSIPMSPEAQTEVDTRRKNEAASKSRGNISINIRKTGDDLSYLSMDYLAHLVDAGDKSKKDARLIRDADEFKPMRDAVAHTALLTDEAKKRLSTVRENIKARVKALVSPGK